MAIDADIVVEIDGGKVYFQAPGLNEWAFLSAFENKNPAEQATLLLGKVTKVEGLTKQNGTVVTKENLTDCTLFFFKILVDAWLTEINKAMGIAAEVSEKNAPTTVSSASSAQDSTSQV